MESTLLVNPDENSLFQISLTQTSTDYSGPYADEGLPFERTTVYPFAEKTYSQTPVTAEQLWACISAYAWT